MSKWSTVDLLMSMVTILGLLNFLFGNLPFSPVLKVQALFPAMGGVAAPGDAPAPRHAPSRHGGGGQLPLLEPAPELGRLDRLGQDEGVENDDGEVGEEFDQDELGPEDVVLLVVLVVPHGGRVNHHVAVRDCSSGPEVEELGDAVHHREEKGSWKVKKKVKVFDWQFRCDLSGFSESKIEPIDLSSVFMGVF